MSIKLIAFDLDGTSIVNHWELPEDNRRALLAAAERGVMLVPATGRMRDFLPPAVLELPAGHARPSNAGAVFDLLTGEAIIENLIPSHQAHRRHKVLSKYKIYMEYYFKGSPITQKDMRDWALAGGVPQGKQWLIVEKSYTYTRDLEETLSEARLCPEKVNLPYIPQDIREELFEELAAIGGLRITSSIADNMEINAEAAHKGAALLELAKRLGLKQEELFAIGDNGNDLTMLEAAGCSVAVEDGNELAKAAARYVTAPHDAGGLARAIERFVLGAGEE